MFKIDGKELDLTKPETLRGVTIKEGGYIEQAKDGQVVRMTQKELDAAKERIAALENA
jgi:hypothetical protein